MAKNELISTTFYKKTLLVGVQSPNNKTDDIEAYYEEFLNLAKTYGIVDYVLLKIKLRSIESGHYFTKGKLAEIKTIFDEGDFEEIIVSDTLSGQQERNLHEVFDCPLMDRTRLILAIFEKSAVTAEGKIQVEIAKLQFAKTRVTGHGVHLDQQAGTVGIRSGPGETVKEATIRYLSRTILTLKGHLEKIEKARGAQRKQRLTQKVPLICLVGYTNAGKSTILNVLTHSDVLAKDQLFATLDTTTRQLFVGTRKIGLLSDTVGFIQQLPHQLIESFKSTLAELSYASLLLVVTDIADNNWKNHIDVVLKTLEEIDVKKQTLFVFNKADKITKKELQKRLAEFGDLPHVAISCIKPDGTAPLKRYLASWKPEQDKAKSKQDKAK
ncbi:MAG: GTPase HflX [Candidatus Dependentiae bacterium]|nr:GTPase HflX [Candidatus Dependentiae bacterium]